MHSIYFPILLIFFGFLPSLVWLNFYLHKDRHPEPTYLITRTFLMGILLAPLAIAAQWLFAYGLGHYELVAQPSNSATFYLWAAFIEETVKFIAVMVLILHHPEFDEPVDAMVYMITAGLGFAAIENILVLVQSVPQGIDIAIQLWILRFLGATLLHSVASALTGYFLALSWFYRHHSYKLIGLGLFLATLVHVAFNIILVDFGNQAQGLLYVTILLLVMSFLVSLLFNKVQNRTSKTLSTVGH